MSYFGIGLHILIALFFAIHALKTERSIIWLFILFSFPLLGSVVYFFAEYLPSSKVERSVKQVSTKAISMLDPSRSLREARESFELTPTIQNRMRLAAALDNAGEYEEAAAQFDHCLQGPFADDPEVCFGAAKAKLHINAPNESIKLLLTLKEKNPEFRPEELNVQLALCYAEMQDDENARQCFIHAYQKYGSAETALQYGIWAATHGDLATAQQIKADIDKDWKRWNKHSRNIHRDLFNKLNDAITLSKQPKSL